MANTFLNPTSLLREAIRLFENNISGIMNVKRISKKDFEIGGRKAGTSVPVHVPNLYTVRTGATFTGQDLTETNVNVAVNQQWGVDITGITSLDMSMKLEDFSSQFIEPNMNILAAKIESDFLSNVMTNTPNLVGTAGTTPQSALVYLQAAQKLSEMSAPLGQRSCHITPAAQAATVDALKGLFNSGAKLKNQYQKGAMGDETLGFDFYMNQSLPVLTTGTRTSTAALTAQPVNGATTIALNGLGIGGTITAGEVFTLTGIYAVNRLTKVSTGALQQFVATAGGTADGTGAIAALAISPAINFSGAYQNVSAQPTATNALTFVGAASTTYPQHLSWYRDAIAFVTIEAEKPKGVHISETQTYKDISMRLVSNFDINNDRFPLRFDVYGGYQVLRPDWVCRVTG